MWNVEGDCKVIVNMVTDYDVTQMFNDQLSKGEI